MSSKESFFTDLDQTRDVLEAKAAEVERRVLRPARSAFVQTASSYPLTTLFATTLLLLSIFPLVSFIGWCLFSGSIILFFTLVFFTVTASIVIGSAAVLFAASLAFAIAISTGVTIAAGVAILAYRMLVNVRTSGSVISGTRASIDEVKQYFAAQPAFTGNGKHETLDAYVIKEEK